MNSSEGDSILFKGYGYLEHISFFHYKHNVIDLYTHAMASANKILGLRDFCG